MTQTPRSLARAGFTLVELLVTLIVLSLIMASTVGFFKSQNQAFIQGSQKMDMLQTARFSVSQVERVMRTLGAGVTGQQPMLVYGDSNVVAFNTDYTENDTTNFRWAVYFDPGLDSTQSYAWDLANATSIPTTSYIYPPQTFRQANGALSPAETMIFFLVPDTSTSRTDDYVLYQQVNNWPPEMVSRNVLKYPSRPFFQYFSKRSNPVSTGVGDTLFAVPSANLPLIRRLLAPTFTSTDTANALRPDGISGIRINFRITNGLTGSKERLRDISTMVDAPNNGVPAPYTCGRAPFPPATFTAVADTAIGSGRVWLRWTPSVDQNSGELDVWQYIVYRRADTATVWEDPLMTIKRDTSTTYQVLVGGNIPGIAYDFGVASEDCTPLQSTIPVLTVTAP